jgi:hypothetical protein
MRGRPDPVRLTIAALWAAASPAAAAPPATAAQSELIRLEQDYARALIAKDVGFLKSYYAPDWRGGDWMGFGTKTNIINLLIDRRYRVASMKLRDVQVRLIGDVAIVQGIDEETSAMGDKDTSGIWGFTDIFARRGGRWTCIASQTTQILRGR